MKKIKFYTLLLLMFSLSISAFSQKKTNLRNSNIGVLKTPVKPIKGDEVFENVSFAPSASGELYQQHAGTQSDNIGQEIWMGFSSYDLMSNSCTKHRVHSNAERAAASWTYHDANVDESTTFPSRGTGYNFSMVGTPAAGLPFPAQRVEESTRTGWANVVILDSGREVSVSHDSDNHIVLLTKDAGSSTWTQSNLPTGVGTSPGLLWPHIDATGNTIHLVCITTPTGLQGAVYQGMDGALLYFRSQDGGDTWDKQDIFLPGVSSDNYSSFPADGYFIDAEGDHVVVSNFNDQFGDVDIWISHDAGESFVQRKALDFPIENYVVNDGYTVDDVGGADPNGPAGDGMGGIDPEADDTALHAVELCDGTGSVTVDANGLVHAAFGRMYQSDFDTTDAGWVFYPLYSGIYYWNSDMEDDEPVLIQETIDAVDVNGNDTIDIVDTEQIPSYGGSSMTSNPFIVVTEEGNIVVAYHMTMENYIRAGVDGDPFIPTPEHYRQIFMTASSDGATWQTPYHVINDQVMIVPSLIPSTEAVFPHLHTTNNLVHMTFQWDDEPGMFVRDQLLSVASQITGNTQSYWSFDVNEIFPSVGTEEVVNNEFFKFEVSPNPAQDLVTVQYDLEESASASIQVFNVVGQQMMSMNYGQQARGQNAQDIDLSQLAPGMYLLTLRSDNKVATQKLIVE